MTMSTRTTLRILMISAVAIACPAGAQINGPTRAPATPASAVFVVASIDVLPQKKAEGDAIIRDYVAKAKVDRRLVSVTFLQERSTQNHYQVIEVLPDRRGYDDHVAQPYVIEYRTRLHAVLGSPYDERLFSDAGR